MYDATLGGLLSGCGFSDVLIPALHASSSQALVGMGWVTLCLYGIKKIRLEEPCLVGRHLATR